MLCVVFDCFGTLVGSQPALPALDAVAGALAEELVLPPDVVAGAVDTFVDTLVGSMVAPTQPPAPPTATLCARLQHLGPTVAATAVDAVLWRLVGTEAAGHHAMPGAVELLHDLGAAGHRRRLLTNCVLGRAAMLDVLEGASLAPHLDELLMSSDGEVAKPHPEAFVRAGEGRWTGRVMVGDDEAIDLAPARALGWDVVAVGPDPADAFAKVRRLVHAHEF